MEMVRTNPAEAVKEVEKDPKLLGILLSNDQELKQTKAELSRERNERIKYINMTSAMQAELEQKAKQLQTSQGLLIGVGLLFFLEMLSKRK